MMYLNNLYGRCNLPVVSLTPMTCESEVDWFSLKEIKKVISTLKLSRAADLDNIPPEIIKSNIDWWAKVFHVLF